jgi:hypothetical protein
MIYRAQKNDDKQSPWLLADLPGSDDMMSMVKALVTNNRALTSPLWQTTTKHCFLHGEEIPGELCESAAKRRVTSLTPDHIAGSLQCITHIHYGNRPYIYSRLQSIWHAYGTLRS